MTSAGGVEVDRVEQERVRLGARRGRRASSPDARTQPPRRAPRRTGCSPSRRLRSSSRRPWLTIAIALRPERVRAGRRPRPRPLSRFRRPVAPSTSEPSSADCTCTKPMPGCSSSPDSSFGCGLFDLLRRESSVALGKVDQPEVARCQHGRLRFRSVRAPCRARGRCGTTPTTRSGPARSRCRRREPRRTGARPDRPVTWS